MRHGFRYFKNRAKFSLTPQNAVQDKMGTEIGLEVLFAKVAVKLRYSLAYVCRFDAPNWFSFLW